jgi:hypothetical protein
MEPLRLGGISPHLQLLALQEDASRTLRESDRQEVDQLDQRIETARAYQRVEIQRAQEEREDASTWEDVAGTLKTVSIVAASAAAIAATGGGGAPAVLVVAGAAMKIGARVAEETGVISEDVALALDIGGSAAMGGGAAWGAAAAGTQAANAASYAAEGASTAGSCASLGTTVIEAARWTSVAASFGRGVAVKLSSDHAAKAVDHDANNALARSAGDNAQADRDAVIDRSARGLEQERWLTGHAAPVVSSENQTRTGVIANIGRTA